MGTSRHKSLHTMVAFVTVHILFVNVCLLAADEQNQFEFFEKRIRPVLIQSCYECHSSQADEPGGGLRLDSRAGVLAGGESGVIVVPGKPAESLLISALHYDALEMPPRNRLPAEVVADFEQWVSMGVPDPRDEPDGGATTEVWPTLLEARRDWWSYQPVTHADPPNCASPWATRPIDCFVLHRLSAANLSPAPPAAPRTLIRRLSLVLTGLPPTPEQVHNFVTAYQHDPESAYLQCVDTLLESPHFGERWARHWMDVVRYTETHGNEWNYEVHHAWQYRDYLIRAFNQDVPYDQLIREQIAGDLLDPPRWNEAQQINESLIGTSFYRFGEVSHDNCATLITLGYDVLDNQIDTLTKAFQASTVACARCHHHKIDAISMDDYYALLGILKSSRLTAHTLDAPSVNATAIADLQAIKSQIRTLVADAWLSQIQDIPKYLLAAQSQAEDQPPSDAPQLHPTLLKNWREVVNVQETKIENPLHLWRTVASTEDHETAFGTAARAYTEMHEQRQQRLLDDYTTLADFATDDDVPWRHSGQGHHDKRSPSGEFTISHEGDTAINSILPSGRYTHLVSEKLNGTLRSPVLPTNKSHISAYVLGEHTSAFRLISNNCQLNYNNYRALTSAEPTWVTFKLPQQASSLWTFAELVTKYNNPKFPDQLGTLGGDTKNDRSPWREVAGDPRSYFGIMRVLTHDSDNPPELGLQPLLRLTDAPSVPGSLAELADRYAQVLSDAVTAWSEDRADDNDVFWLRWIVTHNLLDQSLESNPQLQELVLQYRDIDDQRIRRPRLAAGVADFDQGLDHPVFERGNYQAPGKPSQRRYLEVLSSDDAFRSQGSGRKELAEAIASPTNPLTARVMVNRVWHHLFGSGIVRSVDDFGRVGELPSHPQLLDYLAARFTAPRTHPGGLQWSIKQLVRQIVTTQTFRMSSVETAEAQMSDPQNRLFHHYPARRMEAEAIRDSILLASGRLDRRLYGLSIDPHRGEPNTDRRLFAGPLDGEGRRSLYIKINLMEGPEFLSSFNLPGGKITLGRRDVTNVPAQALTLLNGQFVIDQAKLWGHDMVDHGPPDPNQRIETMFLTSLGRSPSNEELKRFHQLIDHLAKLHGVAPNEASQSPNIWSDVAHVMFNLKEFIYIP